MTLDGIGGDGGPDGGLVDVGLGDDGAGSETVSDDDGGTPTAGG